MTERGLYEATLFEIRKAKAPHIHLEEFNYFSNKGVQEYANESYEKFETTQQTSDAISALTSYVNYAITYTGTTPRAIISGNSTITSAPLTLDYGQRYSSKYVQLPMPDDYFHLLNCVSDVRAKFNYKCFPAGYVHSYGTRKLNADSASDVISNSWLKPDYNRTFYKQLDHNNIASTPKSNNTTVVPDIQVYYGMSSKFELSNVYCEYLRQPKIINLLESALDLPTDTSATLEFPPYVCNEIVKRIVKLILENSKDPRIQSYVPTNSSVK